MDDKPNQIAINLLRVGAYLLREGNRIATKYDLNQQQFVVLNYVKNNKPVKQNQIVSSLVFEKSNVSKIIKKLESIGYIRLYESDMDSRGMMIETTAKGNEVVDSGIVAFSTFHKDFLGDLSDFEIENGLLFTNMLSQLIRER